MASMTVPADELLDRLAALPAGVRLLDAVGVPLTGVWVVGGAVRDLALGGAPHELDLLVTSDAAGVASALRERLGGSGRAHGDFGTHTVDAGDVRMDVAMARTETYPASGALPAVQPTEDVGQDLRRRDFTVNALALGVSPDVRGRLEAAEHAAEDLGARRLRVLHARSFRDDPTRLLRLVRYAARLGFAVEPGTERLAREAFAAGAPATAGAARMGSELMLLLAEAPEVAVAGLVLLRDLGGEEGLDVDEGLLRRAAGLVPSDGRVDLTLLAAAARRIDRDDLVARLTAMHLRRADAAAVLDAAADPEGLATAMRQAARPSALARLLRARSVEAVALAATFDAEEPARRWLDELRRVRLGVTGSDLLRAGVSEGPEVGRRLDAALERKLDDGRATRDEELRAALDAEA